jgi:hypothetical protein
MIEGRLATARSDLKTDGPLLPQRPTVAWEG